MMSDLHADTATNRRCVEEFSALASKDDVILLAGDISDDLGTVQWVFERLSDSYGAVVYVPGNHELWLRPSDRATGLADSWAKLQAIWALAADAGVRTRPFLLHDRVWIVPLLSWHHRSWDVEPDVVGRKHAWAFSDYTCCEWPEELMGDDANVPGNASLAQWMDAWNEGEAMDAMRSGRQPWHDVISLSHFLPFQELIPEKRFLFFPELPTVSGSVPLSRRVQDLQPDLHVFGHSHFAWDATIRGTRFVQAPLCTARERSRRLASIKVGLERTPDDAQPSEWLPVPLYQLPLTRSRDAWSMERRSKGWSLLRSGAVPPQYTAAWSEYYKRHARDPENVDLAPWVQQRRARRARAKSNQ
ncbi:hypothetical protein QBZ16_004931 [Prototheca wickerhamii]|uniref:Calcineurin-like phosphoesterase domain-containing protein n=1 Tax=Prototheca wickerhamii TaxID=3111 RepID=A0AAD9MHT0_PROWI|nr:hypothetical protein QBZ16_004931 [Prototheca wickerhamii]